jgi:GGDEF domain-containing protein
MSDEPRSPQTATKRRSRRFVVRDPEDHRATEKIEAFLAGPSTARGRRMNGADAARAAESALDTRADFLTALRRETARAARYRRPASVVAVDFELAHGDPGGHGGRAAHIDQIDRLAAPIGFTLRREARDTDRIARVGPNRFHVLLPETNAADAERFVDRARQACEVWFAGAGLPVRLRIETASADGDRSFAETLAALEARLSA